MFGSAAILRVTTRCDKSAGGYFRVKPFDVIEDVMSGKEIVDEVLTALTIYSFGGGAWVKYRNVDGFGMVPKYITMYEDGGNVKVTQTLIYPTEVKR